MSEAILALAMGLFAGLIGGFIGGAHWAGVLFGRAIRREMVAGRVSREEAELLSDLHGASIP